MRKSMIMAGACMLGLLAGCKDEEHLKMTGDIVGFVKLVDEYGVELADKSNVTVSLNENTTAKTDKSGRFEFRNLAPGNLKIEFKKEGFSTVRRYNFAFVGGIKPAVIHDVNLISLPKIEVQSKNVVVSASYASISGTITEVDRYYFRYYFSDKPDVSNENYVSVSAISFCCGSVSQFKHELLIDAVASPLYMVAYATSPCNAEGIYDYYNYEKGISVNPAGKKLFEPIKLK
jgi:hypothetical protein